MAKKIIPALKCFKGKCNFQGEIVHEFDNPHHFSDRLTFMGITESGRHVVVSIGDETNIPRSIVEIDNVRKLWPDIETYRTALEAHQ